MSYIKYSQRNKIFSYLRVKNGRREKGIGMKQKAKDYLKNLGLDKYKWNSNDTETNGIILAFLLVKHLSDEGYYIEIGQGYGDYWMSPDDLSWSGPVKCVEAWSEIKPDCIGEEERKDKNEE